VDGLASRTAAQGAGSLVVASTGFFVLAALSMLEYPGGSEYAPSVHHYVFSRAFLGDLGSTRTYSGASNLSSCTLFILALVCLGIALIGFADSWQGFGERRGTEVRVAQIYKWSAIGTGLCCIGIGATPPNLVPSAHRVVTLVGFALLVILLFSMLAVQARNQWRRRFMVANVLCLIVLGGYGLVLFGGPSANSPGGLSFLVGTQKIMVAATVLDLGYQAFGVRKALAPVRALLHVAHH
jgi:hypothetical protein